jgi:hypothetical protein
VTRSTIIAAFLAAISSTVFVSSARSEPIFAVYKGAGCDGLSRLPRYQGIFGVLGGVDDFFSAASWTQMQSGAQWAMSCWKGQPYQLALGVPLVVTGGTLSSAAAGAYDAQFRQLGATIVANGQANAFLRLGWEFNGNWYPWGANGDPASFKAAFSHVAGVLRSVPGSHFSIVWNPSMATGTVPADTLWPGDDVVDFVGLDVYNQSWRPQDVDPVVRWQGHLTDNYGLNWLATFAAAHQKRIIIPEWATGTRPDGHGWGDDPLFIHNMAAWMRANNVLYQAYWDFTASDFDGTMSGGKFPLTLQAYTAEFKH